MLMQRYKYLSKLAHRGLLFGPEWQAYECGIDFLAHVHASKSPRHKLMLKLRQPVNP